jgi:hypothetical protein
MLQNDLVKGTRKFHDSSSTSIFGAIFIIAE